MFPTSLIHSHTRDYILTRCEKDRADRVTMAEVGHLKALAPLPGAYEQLRSWHINIMGESRNTHSYDQYMGLHDSSILLTRASSAM